MPERPSPTASPRVTPGESFVQAGSRANSGTVIAVYGTRADVGVTTIATALALAFRSLEGNDVGLAELGARTAAVSDAKAVTATLEVMRGRFAVSVAELGHQVSERALAAFDVADRIVIVTEAAVPSLRATQRVLRLCHRLNYPDEKMCVVVNRFDAPGALSPADIAVALRREVFWKIPTQPNVDVTGLAAKLVER
jgi:Flp pilus assembly CpaE family ATPase